MPTVKESLLDIANKLIAAEDAAPSDELNDLHAALDAGLLEHSDILGLSEEDVDEIRNVGPAARGGQPKPK